MTVSLGGFSSKSHTFKKTTYAKNISDILVSLSVAQKQTKCFTVRARVNYISLVIDNYDLKYAVAGKV